MRKGIDFVLCSCDGCLAGALGPRRAGFPLWGYALAAFLALGLALAWPAMAQAEPVFKSQSADGEPMSLTLHEASCSNAAVLAVLHAEVRAEFIAEFRAATLFWGGRTWAACYIELRGTVLAIDEEGAPLNPPHGIPRSKFVDGTI